MKEVLILGLGGWLGTLARYYLGLWSAVKWGSHFPYGTLLVNALGSLILGFFGTLALQRMIAPEWRLFLAVGFCGAFTTFSTFGWETLQLLEARALWLALLNLLGSLAAGGLALVLGSILARLL